MTRPPWGGGSGWIRTTVAYATDLQSAPFGRSGTLPYSIVCPSRRGRWRSGNGAVMPALALTQIEAQRSGFDLERKKETADVEFSPPGGNGTQQASSDDGAGGRTRTPDLLITKCSPSAQRADFAPLERFPLGENPRPTLSAPPPPPRPFPSWVTAWVKVRRIGAEQAIKRKRFGPGPCGKS